MAEGVLIYNVVYCQINTSNYSYLLFQAVLVTESGRNGKPYFRSSMERLLNLSEHQTLVTGRIHALNILHTLFNVGVVQV